MVRNGIAGNKENSPGTPFFPFFSSYWINLVKVNLDGSDAGRLQKRVSEDGPWRPGSPVPFFSSRRPFGPKNIERGSLHAGRLLQAAYFWREPIPPS